MSPAAFRRALAAMGDAVMEAEAHLNALDAAGGDGDHGITMRLGFAAIKQRLTELPEDAGFDQLLQEPALAFMGVTGGAIGIILARMLMGGAAALRGVREMGAPELTSMLAGMEAAIVKAGKAKPGDKTILDSVHAAHEAAQAATESGGNLAEALGRAAEAAEAAAVATAHLVCRVGRASRLGNRTLGHPDPGAVSFSIMMRALDRSTGPA